MSKRDTSPKKVQQPDKVVAKRDETGSNVSARTIGIRIVSSKRELQESKEAASADSGE